MSKRTTEKRDTENGQQDQPSKTTTRSWSPQTHPRTRAGAKKQRDKEAASGLEQAEGALLDHRPPESSEAPRRGRPRGKKSQPVQPGEQAVQGPVPIADTRRPQQSPLPQEALSGPSELVPSGGRTALRPGRSAKRGRGSATRGRGTKAKGRGASAKEQGTPTRGGAVGRSRSPATARTASQRSNRTAGKGRRVGRGNRTSGFEKEFASNTNSIASKDAQIATRAESAIHTELHTSASNRQAQGEQQATAEKESRHQAQSRSAEVTTWFHRLESVSPNRISQDRALYNARIPGLTPEEQSNMQDSSSASRNTQDVIDAAVSAALSTAKAGRPRESKLTDEKLRVRRVFLSKENDVNIEEFRSIAQTELPQLLLSEVPELRDTLNKYLEQISQKPTSSYYPFIDGLCFELDEGKKEVGYPIIHPKYFNDFLERCKTQNEAMLQRTIMVSVFHPSWLHNTLDFNTEGQWSLPEDVCLPSTQSGKIKMPKPDLAISFKLSSLTVDKDNADPIPLELASCLSPDGGFRCFPFLFMEVKKAGADLADAERDNLYSASQALYNIYQWMLQASREDRLLDKIRVFSFVFNAKELSVRVHRAARSETGGLKFLFDDLFGPSKYTKDQACRLLDSLLENYVIEKLYPILKDIFKDVSNQEVERQIQLSKRRARDTRGARSKRRRTTQNDGAHTGQSFGMSQLNP